MLSWSPGGTHQRHPERVVHELDLRLRLRLGLRLRLWGGDGLGGEVADRAAEQLGDRPGEGSAGGLGRHLLNIFCQ